MRTLLVYSISIFAALILEAALPPYLPFPGAKPDLLLLITVTAGLLRGARFAVGIGFAAGMLQDLFLGGLFGILTLVKMIAGGLTGLAEGNFFKENYFVPPLLFFLASIFHDILKILLSEDLLFNLNMMTALRTTILPGAVVNAVLGLIFYFIFYRLDNPGGKQNG